MCGGVLSAVLSTVAAGMPMMFTSELSPPLMIPVNGCGSGVGTGGRPDWHHHDVRVGGDDLVALLGSRLSHGFPSIDVDRRALEVERGRTPSASMPALGLDLGVGRRA